MATATAPAPITPPTRVVFETVQGRECVADVVGVETGPGPLPGSITLVLEHRPTGTTHRRPLDEVVADG